MEWRQDIAPARTGDTGAIERLREYLTPFVHGVVLAHAPHHLADELVTAVLNSVMGKLAQLQDAQLVTQLLAVARASAKDAGGAKVEERSTPDATMLEARQTLIRLRTLPEGPRERLFLRLVEGIPGPELAEVLGLRAEELRAELERATEAVSRALNQPGSFTGDGYLWDLSGAPSPLLTKLEVVLPAMRFGASQSTGQSIDALPAVGSSSRSIELDDRTATGVDVVAAPDPQRRAVPVGPNPFEAQPRTIAATDLPAEAQGQVPVPQPLPSQPARSSISQRPIPQPGAGEKSRSGSGKKSGENSGRSTKAPAMPSGKEVTRDAGVALADSEPPPTEARIPARIAFEPTAPTGQVLGDLSTDPQKGGETRVLAIPLEARDDATRIKLEPVRDLPLPPPPAPGWLDGVSFKGVTPLFLAGGLLTVAVVFVYATLFIEKRQVRSNWQLTQVVVAAEDLNVGDAITMENVALRSIPNQLDSVNVVKGDALEQILNQRVTVVVQTGDPLFFSQFLSTKLANERLSRRVLKHGRGFTISTTIISSVGQMVTPGDLVDVLVSFPMPGEQGERRAVTLMQKVHVLATGKLLDTSSSVVMKDGQGFGDVTLLLTAEEAEVLTLAAQLGHVVLTLRNEEDYDDDREAGSYTSSDTLLSGERQRLLKEKRANMIQLIRGMPTTDNKKR